MEKNLVHNHQKLATIILCIDYRFWPDVLPVLENKYGKFDLIEVAGASKNIASPNKISDREYIISNIETSVNLHHTKNIVLTNHIDCGAYGGSKSFNSKDEEIIFHTQELEKSGEIIKKKFPSHKIDKILIDHDGEGKILLITIK